MKHSSIEGIVRVSSKGQIVLPKDVRERLGIIAGKKLAVSVKNEEVVLRRLESLSLEEIGARVGDEAQRERIDVPRLIDEAIRWARKQE